MDLDLGIVDSDSRMVDSDSDLDLRIVDSDYRMVDSLILGYHGT